MIRLILKFALVFLCLEIASANSTNGNPVHTVPFVDIVRYSGKWFEIASIPNRFQKECARGTMAEYALVENHRIAVTNSCIRENGTLDRAQGIARIENPESNAELKVSFFRLFGVNFFWGDYWIMGLDPDYRYAFIGTPDRKYGWLIARAPELDTASMDKLWGLVKSQGYSPDKFVFTQH